MDHAAGVDAAADEAVASGRVPADDDAPAGESCPVSDAPEGSLASFGLGTLRQELSCCAAHTKYPLARGLSGQGDMYDAYGFCISSEFAELYKATTRKVYVQYTTTTSVLSSMRNT